MKILIFEFATAMGLNKPSITAEGKAMLKGLLEDLEGLQTDHLISDESETIESETIVISQSDFVTIHGDLKEWLHENINRYDACLPIAPEEDNLLQDITMIIEEHDVEVLGSNSDAVKLTTNKYDMYKALKGKVPVIKTEQLFFNDLIKEGFEEDYGSIFKEGVSKIVKPADGVSCTGVMVVNSFKELKMACVRLRTLTSLPFCIIQDYVPGVAASVSLITNGKTAVPLSLNFQDIKLISGEIDYNGGMIPFKHELSDNAKETAKRAVESIEGLKGYVGVDIILDGEGKNVHIVEINSRLTTPYIALRKIINFNLGLSIVDSLKGELPSEVLLNGVVKFYKEDNSIKVDVLK